MAIGTTFDTLQQAILAEDELALRKANSFRDYLVRQSANRNQGRQVGVNQFDAETRRGLGYRNADEQAADRDARYAYLDRELGSRDRNAASNIEILREQLKQKAAADDERLRMESEKAWLAAGIREQELAQQKAIEDARVQIQKPYYEALANPRPTEAFTADMTSKVLDLEDKQRTGEAIAEIINRKAVADKGWFGDPDYDAAFSSIATGPMAKNMGLVRWDPANKKYVASVDASNLRAQLLGSRTPRAQDQSVTLEPPKPAGADYVAEIVNGKYAIRRPGDSGGYVNLPATPSMSGDMRTTEWTPPTPEDAASVESVINGGAPIRSRSDFEKALIQYANENAGYFNRPPMRTAVGTPAIVGRTQFDADSAARWGTSEIGRLFNSPYERDQQRAALLRSLIEPIYE